MNTEEIWTDVIDNVSDGMVYGHSVNQYGFKKNWMKLEHPYWITRNIKDRYSIIGFGSVPINKLIEFEDLTTEYFKSAIDYIVYAAGERLDIHEIIINWILGPIAEIMNERKIKGPLEEICDSSNLHNFLSSMIDGKFNKTMAKDAFREFIIHQNIDTIINDDRYKLADNNIIVSAIESVISNNTEQFEKAKSDPKIVNWLVGQVMKAVAGKAKAPDVREALLAKLSS